MFEINYVDKESMWLLALISVGIYLCVHFLCKSRIQRVFFGAFTLCFYMYNGFGAVYGEGVADDIVRKYTVFLAVAGLAYTVFIILLRAPAEHTGRRMNGYLMKLIGSDYFVLPVLGLYIFTLLFDLIYPDLKLSSLISPPKADVLTQFQENLEIKMTGNFNPISKSVDSVGFLLFPLYLLCLFRYRKSPSKLFMAVFIPLYIHYCVHSYINRAKVLEGLLLYGAVIWYGMPQLRRMMTIVALIVIPLAPIALVQYAYVRSDQEAIDINSADATTYILYSETQMPTHSEQIFNSSQRINLNNYLVWMVTLPIPKVIIGSVTPVAAAAEMSEIILGKKRGEVGYFAKLAGLLNESVYIYGNRNYWIHAILVGFVIAFAVRMVQFAPVMLPVAVTLCIVMSYTINRAGMGSVLPFMTNRMLALHLMLIGVYAMHIFYLPFKRVTQATSSA